MKTKVEGLKDTLSDDQEKLKTLQAKYNNTKESLKGAKSKLVKAKDRVAELEKNVAGLKKVAKEEFIQSAKFEEHLGQVVDDAIGNMIYTMFLKHSNFDYSCLRDAIIELVAGYKQMARKGEITLEAPLNKETPSIPLDVIIVTNPEAVTILPMDSNSNNPQVPLA